MMKYTILLSKSTNSCMIFHQDIETDEHYQPIDILEEHNKYINRLIIIGKLCISKSKYGKHPHLLFLFKKELNIRNWSKLNLCKRNCWSVDTLII